MKRNLIIGVMMMALVAVAISCQKENMAKGTFTAITITIIPIINFIC